MSNNSRRRDTVATVLRVLVRAALLCFGATLAAVVLGLAGLWWIALFTSVGFGFLGMSIGERWLDSRSGARSVAAFGGLFIVVAASIVALGDVDERLWPNHVVGLTLEQAQENLWATSFAFRGARAMPELGGEAPVFGRYGNAVDYASVVPVVEEGWKPDEPIVVWAVARQATRKERAQLWHQPLGLGVRVAGMFTSDYQEAVKAACRSHQLSSTREPLFIEWTSSPQASLLAAWRTLGTIVAIATGLLFALNVVAKVFQPRRRAR